MQQMRTRRVMRRMRRQPLRPAGTSPYTGEARMQNLEKSLLRDERAAKYIGCRIWRDRCCAMSEMTIPPSRLAPCQPSARVAQLPALAINPSVKAYAVPPPYTQGRLCTPFLARQYRQTCTVPDGAAPITQPSRGTARIVCSEVLNRRTGARRLRDERGVMGIVKGM